MKHPGAKYRARIAAALKEGRENPTEYKIIGLRVLFISSFIVAAVTCTTLAYKTLHETEESSLQSKFQSVSQSTLSAVIESFEETKQGVQILAETFGQLYPDADAWPNVAWLGFNPVASLLGPISSMHNMALIPIVQPEHVDSYETFLNTFYTDNPFVEKDLFCPPMFPNISIWAQNFSDPQGLPYHDVTGEVPFSAKQILTPVTQYTLSNFYGPYFGGYNLHSDPHFASVFDRSIDCAAQLNHTFASTGCGGMSDVIAFPFTMSAPELSSPQDMMAIAISPIFPQNDFTQLTGFAAGGISWINLLSNVVPRFVNDIDCVVETTATVFTVSIHRGVPTLVGTGDLHNTKFTDYSSTRVLSGADFKVTLYPTQDFADEYITGDPLHQALTLLGTFVFCAMLFLCYDVLMHREFSRRQAVLDTKRRFVRFISHEIRTPLNTVRLGLKLFEVELSNLLSLMKLTPLVDLSALVTFTLQGWEQLAQDITDNSESAVEVLNDLLNYDKIEMGTLRLEFAFFSFGDLISRVVSTMQIQAQQKNITLDLVLSSDAESAQQMGVIGDESRLRQVLRNLVSNALKFTPSGGAVSLSVERMPGTAQIPAGTLELAALIANHTAAGVLRVSVKDSGAGLSPQQLDQICSEGVQFHANELQAGQGSGLGLFISKGIVEQHGGKMAVTSDGLGKGVTFTVELPCFQGERSVTLNSDGNPTNKATVNVSPACAPEFPHGSVPPLSVPPLLRTANNPSSPTTSPHTSNAPGRRLLVVDDSPFNRKMLVRLLTSKGYVCEQAEDGAQALQVYSDMCSAGHSVAAVLMDFEMPVMNGPTATRKLREMGYSGLVAGVTGNVLPEDVAVFKAHGADEVLPKPLVLEDFESLLTAPDARTVSSYSLYIGAGLSSKPSPAASTSSATVLSTATAAVRVYPVVEEV